jgi:hypothetical protein
MSDKQTTVDFIVRGDGHEPWRMVLVEEGPWDETAVQTQLHRVQERLLGTLDAALDGQLCEQFPQSRGTNVVIQIDAYNLPRTEIAEFFERFSEGALQIPDYQRILLNNKFVRSVSFELNFDKPR